MLQGDMPYQVSLVPERHEMILDGGAEPGAGIRACLSCDRRMLPRWRPDYEKLVLAPGDDIVVHVGGTGGLRVSDVAVAPPPSRELPAGDQLWLRDHGIDWGGMA